MRPPALSTFVLWELNITGFRIVSIIFIVAKSTT